MTTEELHDVLMDRLDSIKDSVDRQNGRVSRLEDGLTSLKIRDAYWAGGVAGVLALIKILWK